MTVQRIPLWLLPCPLQYIWFAYPETSNAEAISKFLSVGGFQWAAVVMHLRAPRWLPATHALAGLVMLGWIAGECLVLGVFMWPHALWGGVGAIQLLLVTVLMGAFRPQPGLRPWSARLPARERAAPPDS